MERVDPQTFRIEAAGHTLLARSDVPLTPGAVLRATVTAAGQQPQLAVHDPASPPTPEAVVASALGRMLPQQAPLRETVPALLSILGSASTRAALTPEIRTLVEDLLGRLPDTASLARPNALAKALEDSGVSLESRLGQIVQSGQPGPTPQEDRKWQLLALRESVAGLLTRLTAQHREPVTTASAVGVPVPTSDPLVAVRAAHEPVFQHQAGARSALPEDPIAVGVQVVLEGALAEIDASLARLTSHQLQAANAALQQQVLGFFELPMRPDLGHETVLLEFESDGGSPQTEPGLAPFTVRLELPLGEVGVFRAQLSLQGERVAVSTWSDSARLRELLAHRLPDLDAALAAHGFAPVPTVLRRLEAPDPIRRGAQPLVDTKA